jgi:hypothetical protein
MTKDLSGTMKKSKVVILHLKMQKIGKIIENEKNKFTLPSAFSLNRLESSHILI